MGKKSNGIKKQVRYVIENVLLQVIAAIIVSKIIFRDNFPQISGVGQIIVLGLFAVIVLKILFKLEKEDFNSILDKYFKSKK